MSISSPDDNDTSMSRGLLIYDGDCGFCKRWVRRFHAWTRSGFDFRPYQEAAAEFPRIPEENFKKAAQWIGPDSQLQSGAAAMLNALASGNGPRWPLWVYSKIPGTRWIADRAYSLVANNRSLFSLIDRFLYGGRTDTASFEIGCSLFVQGVGLCFAIAFGSLWLQLSGLFGPHGIVPIRDFLFRADSILGVSGIWKIPSLFWINSDHWMLHLACGLGLMISLVGFAGFFRGPAMLLSWVLYLSFCSVGSPFLNFQWDNLLLECGLLAAFLFPWKAKALQLPQTLVRWLLIYLLFRLMFSSGVVKLSSGDATWATLTALDYHFWTQPLPTPLAWWVDQMPEIFLTGSTALMFALELLIPFLFFLPARARTLGAAATILLQISIMLTGNYGFFNLLTIALCLVLIDDRMWTSLRMGKFCLIPKFLRASTETPGRTHLLTGKFISIGFCVIILFMTAIQWFGVFRIPVSLPAPVSSIYGTLSSFRSVNSYGLFATMTTRRLELIVQGSLDGENWQDYEFKWKPDSATDPLPWVAPHMPRLDWQMWFAALDSPQSRRLAWLQRFCGKLLDGEKSVLNLLKTNPFPDQPPRHIRIIAREFYFSELGERATRDTIWKTGESRLFWPAMRL